MKTDPLEIQFHLVHDCIRAAVYADYMAKKKPRAEAWLSICDMFYSEAIIAWNAIFGTNSQSTHWKKITNQLQIPNGSKIKPFGKEMILEYIGATAEEWEKYHASMVDIRNERIAHFNLEFIQENFPNITWAIRSAYLYREWLISISLEYKKLGKQIDVTKTTGEEMIKLFVNQIAEICNLNP